MEMAFLNFPITIAKRSKLKRSHYNQRKTRNTRKYFIFHEIRGFLYRTTTIKSLLPKEIKIVTQISMRHTRDVKENYPIPLLPKCFFTRIEIKKRHYLYVLVEFNHSLYILKEFHSYSFDTALACLTELQTRSQKLRCYSDYRIFTRLAYVTKQLALIKSYADCKGIICSIHTPFQLEIIQPTTSKYLILISWQITKHLISSGITSGSKNEFLAKILI